MDFNAIQMTILEAESNDTLRELARHAGMNRSRGRVADVDIMARDVNVPGQGFRAPSAVEFGNVIYSVAQMFNEHLGRDAQAKLHAVYPLYCRYQAARFSLALMYGWREEKRVYFADNSIEVLMRSSFNPALTRWEMKIAPHGDVC